MARAKRRIPFSYYLLGWNPKTGNQAALAAGAEKIIPSEYERTMDGHIFCPTCFTNLNRIPKEKELFSNQRESFFSHQKRWKHIPCDLRSTKPKGKIYNSWEDARRAVESRELIIVNGFLQEEPALRQVDNVNYEETVIEDLDGPPARVPLARHVGEDLELPSKITSVMGICRDFDQHLLKYYQLPNHRYPMRLIDLLHDIREVTEPNNEPKLYFGIIASSMNAGKTPDNVRMTWLQCHPRVKDFCFKSIDRTAARKGINDNSRDRIIIMYGQIVVSGIGLAIEHIAWGEYALLPEKYNGLLL